MDEHPITSENNQTEQARTDQRLSANDPVIQEEPLKVQPALTLTEAANACRVSKSSIRRALEADKFPNAFQDDKEVWRVPAGDLLTAGFELNRYRNEQQLSVEPPETDRDLEILELKHRLELQSSETERWKSIAGERALALDRVDRAMRVLEAGPRLPAQQEQNVIDLRDRPANPQKPKRRLLGLLPPR